MEKGERKPVVSSPFEGKQAGSQRGCWPSAPPWSPLPSARSRPGGALGGAEKLPVSCGPFLSPPPDKPGAVCCPGGGHLPEGVGKVGARVRVRQLWGPGEEVPGLRGLWCSNSSSAFLARPALNVATTACQWLFMASACIAVESPTSQARARTTGWLARSLARASASAAAAKLHMKRRTRVVGNLCKLLCDRNYHDGSACGFRRRHRHRIMRVGALAVTSSSESSPTLSRRCNTSYLLI